MAVPNTHYSFGARRYRRAVPAIPAVLVIAVFMTISGTGGATALRTGSVIRTTSVNGLTPSSVADEPIAPKVVASCGVGLGPMGIAYDPADRDLYVANSNHLNYSLPHHHGTISVIGPGCDVIRTITLPAGSCPYSVAYDPQVEWMFVTDTCLSYIYVLSGPTILHQISTGTGDSTFSATYDPLTGDMLVSDLFQDGTGIAVYHGTKQVEGNTAVCGASGWECPSYSSIVIADGKIFAGSESIVVVFDARTYHFLTWFYVSCNLGPLQAVLGTMMYNPVHRDIYYGALDDTTGTYCTFSPQNYAVLQSRTIPALHAAAGIAYSPATRGIYIVAGGGPYPWLGATQNSSDVWMVDPSGHLHALHLATDANPYALAYDPLDGLTYVCGSGTDTVYAVS